MIADAVDMLRKLMFSVTCFRELHEHGSFGREQARLMGAGIKQELEWCIEQIEAERKRTEK